MCSSSVEPSPSTISSPVRFFQALNTSAESTSAADNAMRREEKSAAAAPSALVSEVYSVGNPKNTEGRNRSIASKIAAGFGWPGSSSVAAPAENGKVMELAKAVGEEDFWHRKADVAVFELQHVAREGGFAIGHIVLHMDHALGSSGRARRIHPERHLVAMSVGLRKIGGETPQPWLRDHRMRHDATCSRATLH